MNDLDIRSMRSGSDDLGLLARCFDQNGSPRDVAALRWQYLENPIRKAWVDFAVAATAEDRGHVAAVYATLPVRVRVGGQTRIGLQSLDTLTDRAFRGQGLFARLAARTFARAETDGLAFVYGFPNKFSAPGFFGKLGWRSLDPLPFLIRPLRTRYIAAQLKLGALVRAIPDLPLTRSPRTSRRGTSEPVEVHHFDERFGELWSRFSQGVGVTVERDATYLNWRLVDKPNQEYQRYAIFEGEQPLAFVAFTCKDKHGGRVGSILELIFAPGEAACGRSLLSFAVSRLARQGADVALAWCLPRSPNFISYLATGFFPLPEGVRPIELHFGARALDASLTAVINDRSRWYLSYLDSDTT